MWPYVTYKRFTEEPKTQIDWKCSDGRRYSMFNSNQKKAGQMYKLDFKF